MDDHMAHRGHGVFDTAHLEGGVQGYRVGGSGFKHKG
jgi:hypothetical protein